MKLKIHDLFIHSLRVLRRPDYNGSKFFYFCQVKWGIFKVWAQLYFSKTSRKTWKVYGGIRDFLEKKTFIWLISNSISSDCSKEGKFISISFSWSMVEINYEAQIVIIIIQKTLIYLPYSACVSFLQHSPNLRNIDHNHTLRPSVKGRSIFLLYNF